MDRAKKTLCVVVPTHWDARMGGSQFQAKLLIEHQTTQERFNIVYLTERVSPKTRPVGYKLVAFHASRVLPRKNHFTFAPSLLRSLHDIRPEVIYQRVGCSLTGVCAYYARRYGTRMVWHISHDRTLMTEKHFAWPWATIENRMMVYGIKNATAVIAQNRRQAELLRNNFGREADGVIPNFHPVPNPPKAKSRQKLVTWIANLKPWKRPELFVQLAESMKERSDVRFVMIGAPQKDTELTRRLADPVTRPPNLDYLGACSQETVNKILAESHVFVNTSIYEGFPNTFIQAWLQEVPTVSLHVDIDIGLEEERLGFAARGDYERFRASVQYLLDHPDERSAMGVAARGYAERVHSEKNAELLVDLLDRG